jgi:peptidoglycan hydrolase-like protein with peptidoglycan-binding domain
MALTSDQVRVVREAADKAGIPQALLLGIVDKESAGRVLWSVPGYGNVPAIRPETHTFYANLSGAERDLAVRQGLASKKANGVKLPTTYKGLYQFLDRMLAIDETAALMSISMGIGQNMGFNYRLYGIQSVQFMWAKAQTFVGQVDLMVRHFTSIPKLLAAAKKYDYKTVAYYYNGSGYRANNYDVELKQFTDRWARIKGNDTNAQVNIGLRTSPVVDPYVTKIIGLGYKTVRDFQSANGLEVDGKIGKLTRDKVDEVLSAVKAEIAAPSKAPAVAVGGVLATAGVSGAVEGVKAITGAAQPVVDAVTSVAAFDASSILIAALVLAVGLGAYWLYTKYKAKQQIALVS